MYTRRALIPLAFAVTALGLPCPRISHAQGADYPAAGRYITAVCMFAPGSGADIFVRFYVALPPKADISENSHRVR